MFRKTTARVVLPLALLPAAAGAVEKPRSEGSTGSIVGSLEFLLGFGDQFEIGGDGAAEGSDPSRVPDISGDFDASSTLAIVPAVEKRLGSVVAVGAEYMFVWAKTEDASERRLIMSPHVRARMSFPVYDRTTFDAMLGVGPTIWTSDDEVDGRLGDLRFGWSLRFAFGASYAFNDAVSAFFDVGYYTSTSYGDDLDLSLTSIPVGVGLRSQF